MPSYLHPRSRSTMSLFTGCLAVSFLVVGMPHILPCPVDRRQYSESQGSSTRRRRFRSDQTLQSLDITSRDQSVALASGASNSTAPRYDQDIDAKRGRERECPVPKPQTIISRYLGLGPAQKEKQTVVVMQAPLRRTPRQDTTITRTTDAIPRPVDENHKGQG